MPLSHAERQRLYRDRHESKPEAKERLAVAKRATREENKRTNTAATSAYECSLQKLRSHRARDKKKLKKVNMLRRKDGLSAITLKQLAGRGGGGEREQWRQRRLHLHLQLHLQFQHRGNGPEDSTPHRTQTPPWSCLRVLRQTTV